MQILIETILITSLFFAVALALIGIGWFITGKQRIRRGACGSDPTKRRNHSCETKRSCSLCHTDQKENDE